MALADQECFVYVVLPGQTRFVTAGRFVLRRSYRERHDAVELDPVELRLKPEPFQTVRMGGFFGAVRDALPDFWGRQVIERKAGLGAVSDFELLLLGPDNRTLDLGWIQETAVAILSDASLDLAMEQTPSGVGQLEQLLLAGGTSLGGPGPRPRWKTTRSFGWRSFPGRMTAGTSRGWNTPPCSWLAAVTFRFPNAGLSG